MVWRAEVMMQERRELSRRNHYDTNSLQGTLEILEIGNHG